MVGYCYICKIEQGQEDNVSFHMLPKNEQVRAKWFSVIGRTLHPHSTICSKHFKESDFIYKVYGKSVRRYLKAGVCPSVLSSLQSTEKNAKNTFSNKNTDEAKNDINIKTEPSMVSDDEAHESTKRSDIELYTNLLTSDVKHETIDIQETVIDIGIVKDEHLQRSDTELYTCTSVTSDVAPEFTNIDGTVIDVEIARDKQLKRKTGQSENSKKRVCTPRYVGDLCREDFTSNETWCIFESYLTKTKYKLRRFGDQIRRLNKKLENVQEMMDYLKENRLLSSDAMDIIQNYKIISQRPNFKRKCKTNKRSSQSN